ncbi:hypothetical protein PRZ48_005505 [Zasmidium cellare]|uniref:MmgE/PrpD N-terminal domain-containing protein n=1 Tax=Zasmidium cellare TaxID=395010 RepID=A0ABR0ESI9_ZASCE|nr:hypothetical protein PRZ48_005505 [Zasmidium cellare]
MASEAVHEQYTARLADFAANLQWSDIPRDFQELLPTFILDNVSAMPVYQAAARMAKITYGSGGEHETYSAIDDTRTSLSGAAFLNGVAAGCFEFEHVISTTHPASAMFPALLTVAAAYHKTGEQLLTAMVVGYELCVRIGFASTKEVEEQRGFHNPGLNGHLATAAAVCRLMGWDASTTAFAMGIAASSASGLMAFVNTGAMTKRLHPARSGQLGMEAAFLAKEGVVGPPDVIENSRGFLNAFSPHPEAGILTHALGQEWKGRGMMLKLSPVHMIVQAFVYAINQSRDRGESLWAAEHIKTVTVSGGQNALRNSHMIRLPESLVSAQYSVPFSIAAALTTDLRDPLNMNDTLLTDSLTRKISENMEFVVDSKDTRSITGKITICCGGEDINIDAGVYPGLPGSAGYARSVIDKFERVTSSLDIIRQITALRSMAEDVANLKDLSEFVDLLVEAGTRAHGNINPIKH